MGEPGALDHSPVCPRSFPVTTLLLRGRQWEPHIFPSLCPVLPSLCLPACLVETVSALAAALKDSVMWESRDGGIKVAPLGPALSGSTGRQFV